MERIKYYRGKMGLSQKELAEMIDIDPHYLSSLEGKSYSQVSKKYAEKLAKVFGISFFELVGDKAWRYKPVTDQDKMFLMKELYKDLSDEAKDAFKKTISEN